MAIISSREQQLTSATQLLISGIEKALLEETDKFLRKHSPFSAMATNLPKDTPEAFIEAVRHSLMAIYSALDRTMFDLQQLLATAIKQQDENYELRRLFSLVATVEPGSELNSAAQLLMDLLVVDGLATPHSGNKIEIVRHLSHSDLKPIVQSVIDNWVVERTGP